MRNIYMGDKVNYIRRHIDGIELNSELGSMIKDTSLKKYINELCMKNLSTYDGRREATSKYLNENNNIPIYIDKEIFLYPIKSLRVHDTVFVNFNELLSVKMEGIGYTKFIFSNLSEITLEVSINRVKKQHIRIRKILDYMGCHN